MHTYKELDAGDKKVRARGLTWGEVKQLHQEGVDLENLDVSNVDAIDRILGLALEKPEEGDELVAGEAVRLVGKIVELTYPAAEEKKGQG